jgi:hypothetical protein
MVIPPPLGGKMKNKLAAVVSILAYFLRVLTSVAIATAYHPYRTRSTSATFKTFVSTIGSDRGINILHEFEPGIRQIMKGHAPKFVSRIEERIANDQTDQTSSDAATTPR